MFTKCLTQDGLSLRQQLRKKEEILTLRPMLSIFFNAQTTCLKNGYKDLVGLERQNFLDCLVSKQYSGN